MSYHALGQTDAAVRDTAVRAGISAAQNMLIAAVVFGTVVLAGRAHQRAAIQRVQRKRARARAFRQQRGWH